jgi:hypothetical protein
MLHYYLSKFNEETVRWRVLGQTMAETRSKVADMPPAELDAASDEAVGTVRKDNPPKAGRCVRLLIDANIIIRA